MNGPIQAAVECQMVDAHTNNGASKKKVGCGASGAMPLTPVTPGPLVVASDWAGRPRQALEMGPDQAPKQLLMNVTIWPDGRIELAGTLEGGGLTGGHRPRVDRGSVAQVQRNWHKPLSASSTRRCWSG